MIRVAVSLIVHSSPERLSLALKNLSESLQSFAHELWVIDNASGFDVFTITKEQYPNARIIRHQESQSFGACHNQVISQATADLILFLDDTVDIMPQTVHQLERCLSRHEKAAIATTRFYLGSLDGKPKTIVCSSPIKLPVISTVLLCYLMRELGGKGFLERRELKGGLQETKVDFASNACLLARRSALLSAGKFDESFRLFLEDVDLGYRLRHQDHEIYQAESARVVQHTETAFSPDLWKEILSGIQRFDKKYTYLLLRPFNWILRWILWLTLKAKHALDPLANLEIKEFHRILVYKEGSIKDYLMITPALRALRKRYPEAQIVVLGNAPAVHILDGDQNVSEIREIPEEYLFKFSRLLNLSAWKKIRRFLLDLSTERFDLVIEFQVLFSLLEAIRVFLAARASRSPWSLGLNTGRRGLFLTHKIKDKRRRPVHATRRFQEVLGFLGIVSDDFQTKLVVPEKDLRYADQWLRDKGVTNEEFLVAVHPMGEGSSLSATSWPREHYVELLKQLGERFPLRFLVIEGSSEREINWVNAIWDRLPSNSLKTEEGLSVLQSAALLKRSKFFITNDGDLMHLALSVQCPTLGIIGPGDFQLDANYGQEADLVAIYRPIDCRPCVDLACQDPRCLKSVAMETVLEAASEKIESLQGICRLASNPTA